MSVILTNGTDLTITKGDVLYYRIDLSSNADNYAAAKFAIGTDLANPTIGLSSTFNAKAKTVYFTIDTASLDIGTEYSYGFEMGTTVDAITSITRLGKFTVTNEENFANEVDKANMAEINTIFGNMNVTLGQANAFNTANASYSDLKTTISSVQTEMNSINAKLTEILG